MSKEFRYPLNTCLTILQMILMSGDLKEQAHSLVMILIAQINLLLVLVNDMLDLQLIEESQFVPKLKLFKPRETFEFIQSMLHGKSTIADAKIEIDFA